MSASSNASPRSARPGFSVRGLLDRFAAADSYFRQRHELASLNDHLLRDIGVTRADVGAELRRRADW